MHNRYVREKESGDAGAKDTKGTRWMSAQDLSDATSYDIVHGQGTCPHEPWVSEWGEPAGT